MFHFARHRAAIAVSIAAVLALSLGAAGDDPLGQPPAPQPLVKAQRPPMLNPLAESGSGKDQSSPEPKKWKGADLGVHHGGTGSLARSEYVLSLNDGSSLRVQQYDDDRAFSLWFQSFDVPERNSEVRLNSSEPTIQLAQAADPRERNFEVPRIRSGRRATSQSRPQHAPITISTATGRSMPGTTAATNARGRSSASTSADVRVVNRLALFRIDTRGESSVNIEDTKAEYRFDLAKGEWVPAEKKPRGKRPDPEKGKEQDKPKDPQPAVQKWKGVEIQLRSGGRRAKPPLTASL